MALPSLTSLQAQAPTSLALPSLSTGGLLAQAISSIALTTAFVDSSTSLPGVSGPTETSLAGPDISQPGIPVASSLPAASGLVTADILGPRSALTLPTVDALLAVPSASSPALSLLGTPIDPHPPECTLSLPNHISIIPTLNRISLLALKTLGATAATDALSLSTGPPPVTDTNAGPGMLVLTSPAVDVPSTQISGFIPELSSAATLPISPTAVADAPGNPIAVPLLPVEALAAESNGLIPATAASVSLSAPSSADSDLVQNTLLSSPSVFGRQVTPLGDVSSEPAPLAEAARLSAPSLETSLVDALPSDAAIQTDGARASDVLPVGPTSSLEMT